MKLDIILPTLMCVQSIIASIIYACNLEFNKALYWACAFGITYSVTRM